MMANGGYAPSTCTSRIPRYFPDHLILKLDKQIHALPENDQDILACRYAYSLAFDDIARQIRQNIHYVRYNLERIENTLQLPR